MERLAPVTTNTASGSTFLAEDAAADDGAGGTMSTSAKSDVP